MLCTKTLCVSLCTILLLGILLLLHTSPYLERVFNLPLVSIHHLPAGSTLLLSHTATQPRVYFEKLMCGTPITHVGLVVPIGTIPHILHVVPKRGVTVERLDQWICRQQGTYNHQVFVRQLYPPLDNMEQWLHLVGMPYTYGFWKAVMNNWWPGIEMPPHLFPNTMWFCSELVSYIYQQMGVLNFTPTHLHPSLILPCDFWNNHRLPFRPPFSLQAPEFIQL